MTRALRSRQDAQEAAEQVTVSEAELERRTDAWQKEQAEARTAERARAAKEAEATARARADERRRQAEEASWRAEAQTRARARLSPRTATRSDFAKFKEDARGRDTGGDTRVNRRVSEIGQAQNLFEKLQAAAR
jgi:hypothetical protein